MNASYVSKKLLIAGQAHVNYILNEAGLPREPRDVITLTAASALNISLDRDAHQPRRSENWELR